MVIEEDQFCRISILSVCIQEQRDINCVHLRFEWKQKLNGRTDYSFIQQAEM